MMKSVFKSLLFLTFISMQCGNADAQDPSSLYKTISIASPTAASLGKYADVPVNYHTGIPDITIPLYTVKEGPLSLPISLSYHASGLKVSETSSWVGAGWSLNAGGVITRSVRGLPDERSSSANEVSGHFSDYGYNSYSGTFNTSQYNGGTVASFYFPNFQDGHLDGEPDLFFFNFNGHSGKFFFRDDRTPIILPEQDIKIEYNYSTDPTFPNSGGGTRSIRGFIITTEDGVKYYFGKTTDSINPNDPVETTLQGTNTGGISTGVGPISSWYLYKVASADDQFSINLAYTSEKYGYPQLSLHDYANSYIDGIEYTLTKTVIQGVRLSSIVTSNGKVDFMPGSVRQDLATYDLVHPVGDAVNTEAVSLGAISIKNKAAQEIKRFNFAYDYFTDSSPLKGKLFTEYGSNISTDQKRLKLLSVREQGSDGTLNPPYAFAYYTEAVPRRLSFSQDHWGFINGANNDRMISTYSLGGVQTTGANRESSFPAMRAGSLQQITYPTGGTTSLNYEANTFWVVPPGSGSGSNIAVGGLRIAGVTKTFGGTAPNIVTSYDYSSYDNVQSSGILYGRPSIVQILRNDLNKQLQVQGFDPNGCFLTANSPNKGVAYSPTSLRPMETTQGNHIGYSRVRVTQTGNGHSEYRYYGNLPQNVDHSDVAIRSIANISVCDPASPNYPGAPLPFDQIRGELQYEGHFNQAGLEISKVDYDQPDTVQNKIYTPALLVAVPLSNPNVQTAITFYTLSTGHKIHQHTVSTTTDQNGQNPVITSSDVYFDSAFHTQLTRKVLANSKGQILTTAYKYPADFRIAACDALDNGFLSYVNNSNQNKSDYNYQLAQCYSNSTTLPPGCTTAAFNQYLYNLSVSRKTFINTLVTNFGKYTPPVNQVTCYTYNLSPGSFSTTYYWKDQNGNQLSLYVDKVSPQNVCAQDGSVSGGPYTKGAVCYTPPPPPPSTNFNLLFDQARANADNILKPIMDMQLVNLVSAVESVSSKDAMVTGAMFSLNNYVAYPAFGYYPNKLQKLLVTTPLSDFVNSGTSANNISINKDSRYEDRTLLKYNLGNLSEITQVPGTTSSFIWDYRNNLPVAKFDNATGDQVAYTGFEGDPASGPNVGNWYMNNNLFAFDSTHAFTGKQSYSLANGSISTFITLNPALTYILSYWTTNTVSLTVAGTTGVQGSTVNGWTYFEHRITGQSTLTVSGSGYIDELRLNPVGSQISTYTYDPAIGITSMTDAKGLRTYYEYDNFMRLQNVKDKDNNIVKHIDYHYQGQ